MIKRILIFFLSFLIAPFVLAEEISNYNVEVEINADSGILVEERISYDFGGLDRHGIYRTIPFKYKARGGNYNLRISDISVSDEKGDLYNFTVSDQGNNKTIKIGDADTFVTGRKTYVLKYRVERAINYFDEHDELYWNVTGNEWNVPIKQSKATIVLPSAVTESNLQLECFMGSSGSAKECSYTRNNYTSKDNVSSVVFINEKLNSREGLTVVVGVPKGVIAKPSFFSGLLYILRDNWIIGLPFLVFFVMLHLWRTRGRDPEGRGTIVAQFDAPKGMGPVEIGTIIDEKVDNFEVSAQLIDLAVRGYIKITKTEKGTIFKSSDYIIEKLKEGDDLAKEFEKKLFNSLFDQKNIIKAISDLKKELSKRGIEDSFFAKGIFALTVASGGELSSDNVEKEIEKKNIVKLSSLKNKFYKDLEEVKKELYRDLSSKGYFVSNPAKVRGMYAVIGGVSMSVFFVLSMMMENVYGVVAAILSGLIIIIFGMKMPAKTRKGVIAKEHILGLKEYLNVAEKDRIDFHNAPEKKPERFEKLLPFAMALKVENEWAKQFKDIYKDTQPTWYNDTSMRGFTALALVNDLGSFSTKANSTLASAPSNASGGGSGFSGGGSGGGFGGGGGGSW